MRLRFISLLIFTSLFSLLPFAHAEQKDWNAQGDASDWYDANNWYWAGVPEATDDAKVDLAGASANIGQTLNVQSLTIGGKRSSEVSVSNFVSGTITPVNPEDNAVLSRRDGKLILKGSTGKITLKGAYKDSEEVIPEEPSFLLVVS